MIAKPSETPRTFKQVWAEKEAAGYQYGHDALENVQLGFRLAVEEYERELTAAQAENEALRKEIEGWKRYKQDIDQCVLETGSYHP
jgi:hypothetical protein